MGKELPQATEMAFDEINKSQLSRRLELILEDSSNAKPINAISAFRKLADIDRVKFILGPMSPEEFGAIAPLATRAGVPLLPFVLRLGV